MSNLPTVEAVFTATPIIVDGQLDKPVWKTAPAYRLRVPGVPNHEPEDAGWVRFAWNAAWFYMAVEFRDKDIVARGDADGLPHYQLGDLAELFLKPDASRWFWEM